MTADTTAGTDEELITRSEAARIAGVHYNTIRDKQKRGELSTVRKVGRRGVEEALIPRREAEALRDSLSQTERAFALIVAGEDDPLARARNEIASLTARVEALQAALEESRSERERLLGEILEIAKSK